MRSEDARLKAAEYAVRADDAFDEDTRSLFLRLRETWNRVAERLEFSGEGDSSHDLAA